MEELIEVYKKKNYKIFENRIPFNLNIGGIRTNNMNPNIFTTGFTASTEMNPEKRNFIAGRLLRIQDFIIYGFPYIKRELHKRKYKALVQTRNVKVYRDANWDDKYDYDKSSAE